MTTGPSAVEQQDLGDGVRLLTLATPGTVTTLSAEVNAELATVVDRALKDPEVKGIVITSNKSDFAAGGDLDELRRCKVAAEAEGLVAPFVALLRRMETSGKPVVAALNGTALGGGLELALGCHRRIAAERSDAVFGLPEATIGLMPGAGGTQRLPRLTGLEQAADLILEGRRLDLDAARRLGIIDDVVPPEQLIDRAKAWALANPAPSQPWDRPGFNAPGIDPRSVQAHDFIESLRARQCAADRPTADAILDTLRDGLTRDLDTATTIERHAFARLTVSRAAKNKIRTLFYAPRAARANAKRLSEGADEVATLAVIGGGVMGQGISSAAARAGVGVVLLDVDDEHAQQGKARIAETLAKQVARGQLAADAESALLARIHPSADYGRLKDAGFVIEAVFERLDLKRQVLAAAAAAVKAGVPIASNTSTIPIAELAEAVPNRSRVIGMHFFAPADRMELLEVIKTAETSDWTLAQSLRLAAQLRKTPIIVSDGLGFFTSRIVSAYSGEALTMLAEGVPPADIDRAAMEAGMRIGPIALADLTKLDLLRDILTSMSRDNRLPAMRDMRACEALGKLVEAGRIGRITTQGVYDYGAKEPTPWGGLGALFPPRSPALAADTIRDRLFYAQSLDAVRCLERGVIGNPMDADLAAVYGWGYPSHLGGVIAYIDTVGAHEFVTRAYALAQSFGERFEPSARLLEMARSGKLFHAE
jgi:3-hydroxyacyl-CoA dehydrogenase/enoyl-CoA hydratase/3-hydroxybutyryl-CoA epimerase